MTKTKGPCLLSKKQSLLAERSDCICCSLPTEPTPRPSAAGGVGTGPRGPIPLGLQPGSGGGCSSTRRLPTTWTQSAGGCYDPG
jgi:hypothetical protein